MTKQTKRKRASNMSHKLTTEQFIEKAKARHGDKYDYGKVDYKANNQNVVIVCKTHGEFKQSPSNHLNGKGCPKCGRIRTNLATTFNTNEFIEKAKNVHGDKYDYGLSIYKSRHCSLIITCKKHGEFTQEAGSHLCGSGCPKCGRGINNTNEFVEKAKLKHGDKYDYSKVDYKNAHNKVTIVCKQHGEFTQEAASHLCGSGCLKCYSQSKSHSTNSFIEKAELKHGDRYDYSKVEYTHSNNKVSVICKEHGEFKQTARNHLNGRGCPKCGLEIVVSKPETDFLDHLNVPNENRGYPIGKYFVDGIVNNTIYEFLGDYWHGHNRLEKGLHHIDIQIKRLLTQYRFEQLQKLTGFNIKYVWEADWNEYKKLGGHLKLRTFKDMITI